MRIEQVGPGYAVCADSAEAGTRAQIRQLTGDVPLIIADPPYGNILKHTRWDSVGDDEENFVNWMLSWTRMWTDMVLPGGALYVWGGIGTPGFRPFFRYLADVEKRFNDVRLANLITWSKKRAYGVKHNYLFTREELAYFCKGDIKKPRCFNIPLLETKRGYAGYNAKYPAKSEFYRRTNVWTDITEIMQGKVHDAQKKQRVMEIPIEVHTKLGEWVVDPFAGSGTTALAAMKLGRRFVVIEKDEQEFEKMLERLRTHVVNEQKHEVVLSHGHNAEADQDQGHQDERCEDQAQVALCGSVDG
jgi:site-specific DNA-methyltransferase (adenine-specific)